MVKCSSCGKFLSALDGVKCSTCDALFHRSCLGMTARTQVAATWRCPPCKKKILSPPVPSTPTNPEDNNPADCHTKSHNSSQGNDSFESIANVDSSPSINIGKEIRLFRKEMQTMRCQEVSDHAGVVWDSTLSRA
ncbi:unnamed protein product [Colias eurytheme]|nr:unnamed protein product [Colias eurytheme]